MLIPFSWANSPLWLGMTIVGEGSFIVMTIQLLASFGIPCVESTFERNVGISKTGKKEVEYTFYQFREYF